MADLFANDPESAPSEPDAPRDDAPLADRLRPRALDQVIGQEHLTGPEGAVGCRGLHFPLPLNWKPTGIILVAILALQTWHHCKGHLATPTPGYTRLDTLYIYFLYYICHSASTEVCPHLSMNKT